MVKGKAWLGIKDPPAGEGQVGQKQHRRAVTSLALLERARAWEWVKDPPAGEGQVGQNTGIIPLFTPHYIGIIPIFTPKNERKSPENLRNSLKISIFASDKAKDLC